jgi:trk system potassium uptake protein TrkH
VITYKQIRQYYLEHPQRPSPARGPKILVIGFALIILVGTLLLRLPVATESGQPVGWLEALFTATSATTVTGLVVVNTETTYSTFGEIVILILIQVGGIGFITLSLLLFRLIGRRVTLYERGLLHQNLGLEQSQEIVRLTLLVVYTIVGIELCGALVLFSQWVQLMSWQQALYYAIFHAISAFCNAGFDLFRNFEDPVLVASANNPVTLVVLSLLITIGTLGVTVIYELITWPRTRRFSLHTRLVLILTLFLTLFGTLVVIIEEAFVNGQALTPSPESNPWLAALFTVVSSRTAGVTLAPTQELGQASQMIILIWMFIGGAPASMAGGVGLGTVMVVLVTLASTVRGYDDVRIFERTLPMETILKAVAIMTVSTALVVLITLSLTLLGEGALLPITFEVVSAFSNTGYSLGITGNLGELSRLLLIITMFWGRLGPLTLVVALAQQSRRTSIHYPEEKIIIG